MHAARLCPEKHMQTMHSYIILLYMQWNLFIAATLGEQHVGRYIGVAFY